MIASKPAVSTTTDGHLNIHGYTDYRAYLRDFYRFRKDGHRGYSYRSFSKAAGFTSPNILKLVIDNQRNISPQAVEKFIKALRLYGNMAEYFRVLVRMNQANSDKEKAECLKTLEQLTPVAKRRDLGTAQVEYLSHWLYPAIREMVTLPSFRDDPYWIARRLSAKATPGEIGTALRFLVKEGFIVKRIDGQYEAADNMVLSSDEVKNLAVRNYHRGMMALARDMLETLPVEKREYGAITFSLPESALGELKYKLKTFRQDLHRWAIENLENQAGEVVVQVNFQMFPQTQKVSDEAQ